jgi:hypothetical protein
MWVRHDDLATSATENVELFYAAPAATDWMCFFPWADLETGRVQSRLTDIQPKVLEAYFPGADAGR